MPKPRKPSYAPPFRRLRVFAVDPSIGTRLETVGINETVLRVSWESGREGELHPGPVGEYVEVVDVDPASGLYYEPVDLNDPYLIAQDGLSPSEGNPQFHQQMVYAVAMTTIDHFERALGRVALWADHREGNRRRFVRRLRIYPHALREANAYYSPNKKALLFGYFPAAGGAGSVPGSMVFTCLSHDIVAHETTHALLDGLHPRFNEATNPDVHALHEAFADIVAIFQHFSNPEILEHQIARTRGDLERQNLLGQIAQQFGAGLGQRGALRDALGGINRDTGEWERATPDPQRLADTPEPHARGAILVAAIFDGFVSMYKARVADLLRIATGGTGVLPGGEIHPDLVRRLAREAAKTATHILQMCIRALDYCPPVDVTFGDYLRALVTADYDMHPEDTHKYRVAVMDAFRAWGIFPEGIRTFSLDALRHELADIQLPKAPPGLVFDWDLGSDREEVWKRTQANAAAIQRWIMDGVWSFNLQRLGTTLSRKAPLSIYRKQDRPALEVHSVRSAVRRGERGSLRRDVVVELTQQRRGYLEADVQRAVDRGGRLKKPDFIFRRGCTLLVDPEEMRIRYVIKTRGKDVSDNRALGKVRAYLGGDEVFGGDAFHVRRHLQDPDGEDFAVLHREL